MLGIIRKKNGGGGEENHKNSDILCAGVVTSQNHINEQEKRK